MERSVFLEVGIGSGCLMISLLKKFKDISCVGLDINKKALDLSKINMKLNKIREERVELIHKCFKQFNPSQKFDFIISNPPYIPLCDKQNLSKELK